MTKYFYYLLAFSFNCWILSLYGLYIMQLIVGISNNSVDAVFIIFFILSMILYGFILQYWNKWFYNTWKYQQNDINFLYNLVFICVISIFFIFLNLFSGPVISFQTKTDTAYSVFFICFVFFDLFTPLLSIFVIKSNSGGLFDSLKRAKKEIKQNKKIKEIEPVSKNNYLYVYKFPHNCLIYDISQRYSKITNDTYKCAIINVPLVFEKIDKLNYLIVLNKYKILNIYKFNENNPALEITKENFSEIKEYFDLKDSLLLKNALGNYILNVEPISEEDFLKFKKMVKKLKHSKELFIFYNF